MTENKEYKDYKTKNLYLAAILKTLGHNVITLENENNTPTKYFVFDESDELQNDIKSFWNNELKVMAKEFYDNVRSLKDWLRAVK